MKFSSICIWAAFLFPVVLGCTPEKQNEAAPAHEQSVLNETDRERVRTMIQDLQLTAGLPQRTFELLRKEVTALSTGKSEAVTLAALVDLAKSQILAAGADLSAKTLPEGLPAGIRQDLQQAKEAMIKAGQLKSESLDAVQRFMEEKKPMILLEYRSKLSASAKQLEEARVMLKQVRDAAGITP